MPTISDADPRPPYVQIAEHIRSQIGAGELAIGARLPSGRALADAYGVAPMTVQHALRLLRKEGILTAWQGRGVFVADPDQAVEPPRELPVAPGMADRVDQLARELRALEKRVAAIENR